MPIAPKSSRQSVGLPTRSNVAPAEYLMAAAVMEEQGLFMPNLSSIPLKEEKVFDSFNTKIKDKDQSRVGR